MRSFGSESFESLLRGLRSDSITRRSSSERTLRSLLGDNRGLGEIEMESEGPYEEIIGSGSLPPFLGWRSLDIPVEEERESVIEEYVEEPRFELRKRLGEGAYGEVYSALDVSRCELVALKLYKSSEFESYEQEKVAYEILSATPNCDPYVVCMYDSGTFQDAIPQ